MTCNETEEDPIRFLMTYDPGLTNQCTVDRMNLTPSFDCPVTGLVAEGMNWVLSTLDVPYILVDDRDVDNYDSIFDPIDRGEVDCIMSSYVPTMDRLKRYDISYPVFINLNGFVMAKQPTLHWTHVTKFMHVFTWEVLLLMGVVAVVSILISCASRWSTKCDYVHRNVLVVVIGWTMLTFTNLYSGLVLGNKLTKQSAPPFQGFDELLERLSANEVHLIANDPKHLFPEQVRKSEHKNFRRLREAMKQNPMRYEKNNTKVIENLLTEGQYAFLSYSSIKMLTLDFKESDQCRLSWIAMSDLNGMMPEHMFTGLLCRKYFQHMANISRELVRIQDLLYGTIFDDYFPPAENNQRPPLICTERQQAAGGDDAYTLTLLDTFGIFCFLFIGLLVCSVVVGAERVYNYWWPSLRGFALHSEFAVKHSL